MTDTIISGISVAGEKVSILASNIVMMKRIPEGMDAWPGRTVVETRRHELIAIVEDDDTYKNSLAQWKKAVLG